MAPPAFEVSPLTVWSMFSTSQTPTHTSETTKRCFSSGDSFTSVMRDGDGKVNEDEDEDEDDVSKEA